MLIDAYGTIEPVDIPSVDRVLNELVHSNLEINGSHFAAVITAHGCANHDLNSAMRVFEDLSKLPENVQRRAVTRLPDVLAYEAILNAVVSHHRFDLMEKYWRGMQASGVQPTAYIYNILIRGYSMTGEIGKARTLFESMSDPVAGAAAPNNHTKQPRTTDTRVYREVSSIQTISSTNLLLTLYITALDLGGYGARRVGCWTATSCPGYRCPRKGEVSIIRDRVVRP